MLYAEHRHTIRDGDPLLFRGGRGPVASAIRWGSRSRYSHVGMAVWVESAGVKRLMVAESREFRGCRLVPLSRAIQGAHVDALMLHPAFDPMVDRSKIVAEALRRLGEPYGWASIGRHALARLPVLALLRAVGLVQRIPLVGRLVPAGARDFSEDDAADAGRSVVCSTYVSLCWRAGGVDPVRNLADRDTTPGDIARSAIFMIRGELEP